jgi:hypothetical protein
LLHWHWFVPIVHLGAGDRPADDEHKGLGPSVHAQLGDWPAPDWHGEPVIQPDTQGRLRDSLTLSQSDANLGGFLWSAPTIGFSSGLFPSRDSTPWGGVRAPRSAVLQRWNC